MAQAKLDQEWVELILQARQLGLKQQEIKDFLEGNKEKQEKNKKSYVL